MIDNLALGLTHGLMLLAAFLLLKRRDLDDESGATRTTFRQRDPRA